MSSNILRSFHLIPLLNPIFQLPPDSPVQPELLADIARLRKLLTESGRHRDDPLRAESEQPRPRGQDSELSCSDGLNTLSNWFGLSSFERDIVTLCAAYELDSSLQAASNREKVDQPSLPRLPTFALALEALPLPHWSALTPEGPLRYWRILELGPSDTFTQAPLRLDERILHYLNGHDALDRRLENSVKVIALSRPLPASHAALAAELSDIWLHAGVDWPALQLCGCEPTTRQSIAATVANALGMELFRVEASDLPKETGDQHEWIRLWEREAILSDAALLVECGHDHLERSALRLLRHLPRAVLISTATPLLLAPCLALSFDVPQLTKAEQRQRWTDALGAISVSNSNGQLDAVIGQFNLSDPSIELVTQLARPALAIAQPTSHNGDAEGAPEDSPLWKLCRAQVASQLGQLADPITSRVEWDALVLPEPQKNTLRLIIAQARHRSKVYGDWGFGSPGARGLGISALFSGPSGTGKTMAAEVIATALNLDLYRIDLSAVVSKYIGETEKNLRQVFDAAESGGSVLLFDEADALFGKRSEVKDSRDRYANIEVSYLLQRMESFNGLSILTTNMKEALDVAFVRRLRFILSFPYPDASYRRRIWEGIFPSDTPKEDLDFVKLSQLNVAGGSIRNIALHAAFLAAADGSDVSMKQILAAAQAETIKLERPLMDAEVKGWV